MEETIKDQLIVRFVAARDKLGSGWRDDLARNCPEFNTKEGVLAMTAAAAVVKDPNRSTVDRLKKVVIAMEQIAEGVSITSGV